MKDDMPMVFDHVKAENSGVTLNSRELAEFAAGIASSFLAEKGVMVKSACRLLLSDYPVIISDDAIYVVSTKMFPDIAELEEETKKEAASLAASLSKRLYSLPISLFCLSGNGSEALSGAGYVVKMGELASI